MSDKQPKKTDLMSEAELDAYHAEKMKKKKEARTRMLATKTEERGLLIVHGRPARDPVGQATLTRAQENRRRGVFLQKYSRSLHLLASCCQSVYQAV